MTRIGQIGTWTARIGENKIIDGEERTWTGEELNNWEWEFRRSLLDTKGYTSWIKICKIRIYEEDGGDDVYVSTTRSINKEHTITRKSSSETGTITLICKINTRSWKNSWLEPSELVTFFLNPELAYGQNQFCIIFLFPKMNSPHFLGTSIFKSIHKNLIFMLQEKSPRNLASKKNRSDKVPKLRVLCVGAEVPARGTKRIELFNKINNNKRDEKKKTNSNRHSGCIRFLVFVFLFLKFENWGNVFQKHGWSCLQKHWLPSFMLKKLSACILNLYMMERNQCELLINLNCQLFEMMREIIFIFFQKTMETEYINGKYFSSDTCPKKTIIPWNSPQDFMIFNQSQFEPLAATFPRKINFQVSFFSQRMKNPMIQFLIPLKINNSKFYKNSTKLSSAGLNAKIENWSRVVFITRWYD
ncbi:hypothetical protein VP01_4121g1 [Puccinia sorghi]|uniref:Uncharacterized protein n=1 Tax=Puccinia sorghi TaxID=27349 RepID=A0A0L6UT45_9BASI|nr:hypothetical protein VP01_4121g1 [Puccinia sorghi]